ncbi:OmpA family protein [Cereibacter sphaeroides]|uniref:OmpA family protein n=1 Tax=Cereibacter sphaeroides TaxID=1063 RepID=UPI000E5AB556|nr:OmpA family protein [Cereibacter sphaeroides]RHZ93532.1 OmpA family protein [Cereibacter sphaeroides]
MRTRCAPLLALPLALALAACGDRPVSTEINDGTFGNATMNNSLLQMGAVSATQALGQRFASEVDPTITFPFDSAALTPDAQATLRRQADWIRQFPEVRFRVYGHTDLVGSEAYNKRLGLRRAKAVVAYLASQGISPARLEALVSYGETRPVIPVVAPEERNRRTVTEVSGFVTGRGAPLNGKYAAVVFREYVAGARREHPRNRVIATQVAPDG